MLLIERALEGSFVERRFGNPGRNPGWNNGLRTQNGPHRWEVFMPSYFFNISDGIKARDPGGIILADECLLTNAC
jgi:hypothetical protein